MSLFTVWDDAVGVRQVLSLCVTPVGFSFVHRFSTVCPKSQFTFQFRTKDVQILKLNFSIWVEFSVLHFLLKIPNFE